MMVLQNNSGYKLAIMKSRLRRFYSLPGILFLILLLVNNLIAVVFEGMAFLSGPSKGHYDTLTLVMKLALYGFIVSLVFSFVSLALNYLFKKYFKSGLTGQLKFFLTQLGMLYLVFIISFLVVFILPAIKY
ncbi:hypothetical protein [Mucilaginibacter aquaedulcis]|uniref:hypothetical protein n=1 Tax=Mucilaginibacter aquaedulcis TaxID=1187081 RepID=UPI0025B3E4E8|nr:hypothetical protein [Mucilaginibacter aquaedulcis]MDN3550956.1 hypothetical protein [Mucilaginibacter aquaedulcis]